MNNKLIRVLIYRKDDINGKAYTNTGLPKTKEDKLKICHDNIFEDARFVYLEYKQNWTMFSPDLMSNVEWWTRSFFSSSKCVSIEIEIEDINES